jgi:nitroreductase
MRTSASEQQLSEAPRIVDEVIRNRRSIRAFQDKPVSKDDVEQILEIARFAPSGTNTQPWRVYVLAGSKREELCQSVLKAFDSPVAEHNEEYAYYPARWRTPYIERRRKVGYALYSLLGIAKEDMQGRQAQQARNYKFFDAPIGLIFTIDRGLGQGSWLDFGMFLQNVMLVARARGLDTCPQAAFNKYHRIISRVLALSDNEMVICAMSLGYRESDAVENSLVTDRCSVSEFTNFIGFD